MTRPKQLWHQDRADITCPTGNDNFSRFQIQLGLLREFGRIYILSTIIACLLLLNTNRFMVCCHKMFILLAWVLIGKLGRNALRPLTCDALPQI